MRYKLLLITLLTTSFNAFSQGNNGLIAHWNFNGNANDVSGHNLNGIVSGATLSSGYNNIANTAYSFNGSSSYITIPYNALLNIDSGSLCFLLKVAGFYNDICQQNCVFSRGAYTIPGTTQDAYSLEFGDNYYDGDCNTYTLSHEVFDPAYHTTDAGSAGLSMWYANSDTIILNTWYCVTTTYAHDSIKLYIDGTLRNTFYMPDNYTPGTDSITIGFYPPGGSQYPYWFHGAIDDIRMYNRPLSPAEALSYCDSAKMNPTSVDPLVITEVEVSIYPNPANNNVNLQLPANCVNSNIRLLNAMGQTLVDMKPSNDHLTIDMGMLPAGLYIFRVECDGKTTFRKIIKN